MSMSFCQQFMRPKRNSGLIITLQAGNSTWNLSDISDIILSIKGTTKGDELKKRGARVKNLRGTHGLTKDPELPAVGWFSPSILSAPVPNWQIVKLAGQQHQTVVALNISNQGQSERTNILRSLFASIAPLDFFLPDGAWSE